MQWTAVPLQVREMLIVSHAASLPSIISRLRWHYRGRYQGLLSTRSICYSWNLKKKLTGSDARRTEGSKDLFKAWTIGIASAPEMFKNVWIRKTMKGHLCTSRSSKRQSCFSFVPSTWFGRHTKRGRVAFISTTGTCALTVSVAEKIGTLVLDWPYGMSAKCNNRPHSLASFFWKPKYLIKIPIAICWTPYWLWLVYSI